MRLSIISLAIIACAACANEIEQEPALEVSSTQQNVITRSYGSYCQEEYQANWQGLNSGGWTTCANFNSSMSQIANRSFYWNLHGVQSRFEESGDAIAGAGADTVDVLWLYTHGGAWSGEAVYAMWDQNSLASTSRMRMGDDSRGLSLWVFHGCETMRNDADLSPRWSPPLSGGLRIAVGSHDQVFAGTNNTGDGQRFATNLKNGQTVWSAWKNALTGTSVDNDGAVIASGANSTHCWDRLNNMTWGNIMNYGRVMDSGFGWICQAQWDNL